MSLAMSVKEREAFLAGLHVGHLSRAAGHMLADFVVGRLTGRR